MGKVAAVAPTGALIHRIMLLSLGIVLDPCHAPAAGLVLSAWGSSGVSGLAERSVALASMEFTFWSLAIGLILAAVGFAVGMQAGQRKARRKWEQLLERAEGQFWEAIVERRDNGFMWKFSMQPSALYKGLFGSGGPQDVYHPWRNVVGDERAAMDKRSRQALNSGAPGYSQEFPIVRDGITRWLQEHVTIRPTGPDRWSLVGVITDVTPLRMQEERLRERDRLVIQALARADCLLWRATVRVENEKVQWLGFDMPTSALYRRLFGDRPMEMGARLWSLLDVPDLAAMNARSAQAVLSGASGYRQEFRALRGPEIFWLHEQVSIAPAGPNEFQLVGVLMDVTALRAAVEARKASEAQMEQLLAHADCLLWQARVFRLADGTMHWVLFVPRSSLHRKVFGRDPEEPAGLRWEYVLSPEQLREINRCSSGAILSGSGSYEQEICARRDGATFWLQERVTIQPAGDNEWYLVGVIFDISNLRKTEAELAAQTERLGVTLAAMADAVITTNREGRILFANRAAGQLMRLAPDSVIGRQIDAVCRFASERGEAVPSPLADVFRLDATVTLPHHVRIVVAGDILVPVEGAGAPVHDTRGNVTGLVLVLRDVTERERLELEISRASKLQSVGLLAGGIAHDFNNLLTVIMGNVVVARQSLPGEGDVAACLQDAERAVLRAKDLTQQLLTFARGGDPVRAVVRLNEVITEAAGFGIHGSSVICEYDLAEDLWLTNIDRGQISQVVQNLIINATQAMPQGGVIRIAARNETVTHGSAPVADGDYVRVTVTDSGSGIPAENLARVFDPYFTTKAQGSGLGLATAYSIIKKHRGAIDVTSRPGAGSTFRFFLPAVRNAAAVRTPAAAVVSRRLSGRILFMDDEEPVRKIGARLLARLGLSVETAADGAEALERFRGAIDVGRPFDIVMVDLTVPGGMGGREAFEKMREIDPGVRGVVSSGYSSDSVLGDFRAHGFDGMIPKPYRLEDCARTLSEVLSRPRT